MLVAGGIGCDKEPFPVLTPVPLVAVPPIPAPVFDFWLVAAPPVSPAPCAWAPALLSSTSNVASRVTIFALVITFPFAIIQDIHHMVQTYTRRARLDWSRSHQSSAGSRTARKSEQFDDRFKYTRDDFVEHGDGCFQGLPQPCSNGKLLR